MNRHAAYKLIGLVSLLAGQFVFISPPAQALLPVSSNPVSAGETSTCVIRASDDLYCVGSNTYGQLGNGNQISTSDPQKVIGLANVSAVSVGLTSACAITHSGSLYCWGDNSFGQLGLGDNLPRSTATLVTGISSVSQVEVGANFACALLTNGTVSCWGANDVGQLRTDNSVSSSIPATTFQTPSGVTQMTVNGKRICALALDVQCWGDSSFQVPSDNRIPAPSSIPGSTGATSVQLGADFGCFTKVNSVFCWGANDRGQLGNGTRTSSQTPVQVTGITSVKDLATGKHFACILDGSNDTYCWGDNSQGQLVVSAKTDQLTRIPTGAPKAVNLDAGLNNLCLLTIDATVSCFGDSSSGQAGFLLASSAILTNSKVSSVSKLSTGADTTCIIDSGGRLECWGDLVPITSSGARYSSVSVGDSSACAISTDKKVFCWGANSSGQLGNNSARTSLEVSEIALPNASFSSVSVGLKHACAVTQEGLAYCWGDNARQQLGSVGAISRIPKAVPGIGTALSIYSGDYHNCVLQASGDVTCWGDNSKKQISATGTTYLSPTQIVSSPVANALALGTASTCILDVQKALRCFGDNTKKQSPASIAGTYKAVTAYGNTVCSISESDLIYCFGAADSNKIGLVSADTSTPTKLSDESAKLVSVGAQHVCMASVQNKLSCWGSNASGQLTSSFGFPDAYADLRVSLVGKAAIGERLSVVKSGSETKVTYTYLWKRATTVGGLVANLVSETKPTYSLTSNDSGKFFSVEVKQSKWGTSSAGYIGKATSPIGPAIRLLFTPAPLVSGTFKVGRTITARPGRWDSGVKLSYQWYRGNVPIKNAKSITYKLVATDSGKQIYVAVTGLKMGLPKVTTKSAKTSKISR